MVTGQVGKGIGHRAVRAPTAAFRLAHVVLHEHPYDLLAALLIVVGALLRLMQPDLVLFKFDEATASNQVMQMVQSGRPIATGTESSVGGLFPPLFDDLLLPPFLVNSSPVLATCYVAVINVLALMLGVVLIRRYAGGRAAYLFALLYALSPWAVVFSRKIWDPYVISLFAVLALAGLLLLLLEGRSWGGALAVGSWLWLLQLHPSAALLAPVGLAALWAGRGKLRLRSLAVAMVLGLAPLLPYLAWERDHHWHDLRLFVQAGAHPAHFSLDALLYPLQNATGSGATQLEDVPITQFLRPAWIATAISWFGVLVLGAGLTAIGVYLVHRWWRSRSFGSLVRRVPASARADRSAALYLLPFAWLAVPTALALRQSTPMFPHYFMTLLPVTFVAVALGLDLLCRWQPRWSRWLVGATSAYALLATLPLLALYRYLPTDAAAGFQYLRYALAVQQAVDRLAPQGPVDLMGLDSDTATALVTVLQPHHAIAATDPSWALLTTAPLQVVIGPPDGTIGADLQPAPGPARPPIVQAGKAQIVLTPVRLGGSAAAIHGLQPLSVQLVDGVRYLGWTATQPKPNLVRVTLGWRIDAASTAVNTVDIAPYVHLLLGDRLIAQHDGIPYASARWRVGQVLYAWFDLSLPTAFPPGDYELRTGMYTRPAVQRIARLGPNGPEDGEFALGSIRLPLTP